MEISDLSARFVLVFMLLGITGTSLAQNGPHRQSTPLTEPGNDIFGTIQEVVKKLEANPNTNWSNVDLEALRQHLLDMKAFTEEVAVLSKKPIPHGTEIRIHPKTARAEGALKRLFSMHPAMLKKEKGWTMNAKQTGDDWIVTCTTDNTSEVEKIRALGYIGLLAEGAHHQLHHWKIATGRLKMRE